MVTPNISPNLLAARVWVAVFLSGFAVVTALFAWTLFTPPFHGDLTRMGYLSEADYGWTAPQPTVPAQLLVSHRLDEADVLVIGDSFSTPSLWQSLLVKSGLRVKTVVWSDVRAICNDFTPWLRRQGFRGALVLLESVERELDNRVNDSVDCASMGAPLAVTAPSTARSPTALPPSRHLNWGEQLMTGARTAFNSWRARRADQPLVLGPQAAPFVTRAAAVPEGCRWFSHAQCGKALFLNKDFLHPALGAATLAHMQSITQQQPLRLVWLVVPNKTSVYFDRPNPFWHDVAQAGLGPDLLQLLKRERDQVRDLYLPNETHLSTAGYLVLGNEALKAIGR